jgi:hypothetical protein
MLNGLSFGCSRFSANAIKLIAVGFAVKPTARLREAFLEAKLKTMERHP